MPLATRARILGCGLVRTVCTKPQVRTRRVRTTLQIGGRGIVATQEEDLRKRNRFVRIARPLAASKGRERGSEDLSRLTRRAIPSPTNPVDTVPIRRVLRPYHTAPGVDQGALTDDVWTMRFVLPRRRRALREAAVRFVASCAIPSHPDHDFVVFYVSILVDVRSKCDVGTPELRRILRVAPRPRDEARRGSAPVVSDCGWPSSTVGWTITCLQTSCTATRTSERTCTCDAAGNARGAGDVGRKASCA